MRNILANYNIKNSSIKRSTSKFTCRYGSFEFKVMQTVYVNDLQVNVFSESSLMIYVVFECFE